MYYKSTLPEPGASVHLGLSSLTDTHLAVPLDLKRCLQCGSAVSSLAVLNIRKKENRSEAFGKNKCRKWWYQADAMWLTNRQLLCLLKTDVYSKCYQYSVRICVLCSKVQEMTWSNKPTKPQAVIQQKPERAMHCGEHSCGWVVYMPLYKGKE